ncbi:hypothetical protein KI387_013535, partial [Taxus chinensis]
AMKRAFDNIEGQEEDKSQPKRQETSTPSLTSIDDLNTFTIGNIFQGNVLVLLRADLTDEKAELTVTLNVAHKFIPMHEDKVVAGKGIQITNFSIAPKTSYDRGDCDVILLLNESSTVESTPPLSIEYKFIPNTTVKQLLNNTEPYAVGTIAAIVTSAKQIGLQLILEIKDGPTEEDTTRLYLFGTFQPLFTAIEEQLQKQKHIFYLFKNVAKRGGNDNDKALKTTQSTFITPLRMEKALQDLKEMLNTTIEVQGTLTIANIYSIPFEIICKKCGSSLETFQTIDKQLLQCHFCQQQCPYSFKHRLICNLKSSKNKNIQCILT